MNTESSEENILCKKVKKAPDYSKGLIYGLFCKDPSIKECYIGSTVDLSSRTRIHKCCCNNSNNEHYNQFIYTFIRDNGGWNNWQVIWLEDYPCNSKKELVKKEREVFDTYPNAVLNSYKPTVTEEEKKEQSKISHKKYLENITQEMKDELQQIRKDKWAENKDNSEFKNTKKEADKKYREKNKEKIKEKKKEDYQKNKEASIARADKSYKKRKEEILAQSRKKVICPCCNKELSFGSIKTHLKTTCANKPNPDDIKELVASIK
tara:strand:- start:155 stop:946 length:792 start_codon:yes stop_codon:yes gene_type:complete